MIVVLAIRYVLAGASINFIIVTTKKHRLLLLLIIKTYIAPNPQCSMVLYNRNMVKTNKKL